MGWVTGPGFLVQVWGRQMGRVLDLEVTIPVCFFLFCTTKKNLCWIPIPPCCGGGLVVTPTLQEREEVRR